MSRLITSVHDLPVGEVKVFSSKEAYDNDEVSEFVMDLDEYGYMTGVIESYEGSEPLEYFKTLLSSYNDVEQPQWYEDGAVDYALFEIVEGECNFYRSGGCDIYVKYDNEWVDFYDLMLDDEADVKDSEFIHPLLGYSKTIPKKYISEIILCTNGCGIKASDLNDRIIEEHDFMTHLSFDENSDIKLMHLMVD